MAGETAVRSGRTPSHTTPTLDLNRELARLQRDLARSRRIVDNTGAVTFLIAGAAGFFVAGTQRSSEPAATLLLAGFVVVLVQAVLSAGVFAVGRHLRRPAVVEYLGRLPGLAGEPLELQLAGRVPTWAGRAAKMLGFVLTLGFVGLLLAGAIEPTPAAFVLGLGVLIAATVVEKALPLGVLGREPFSRVLVDTRGLTWRAGQDPERRTAWYQIAAIRLRRGILGRESSVSLVNGDRIVLGATSFLERRSGEEVDLAMVVDAVRPGRFVRRGRAALGSFETALVQAGIVGY